MKAGTVAVIGRANAGKSTLVNVLVGEKVAIVSPKPQTTRDRILGILNEADAQVVFADTPGIYKAGTALAGRMLRTAETAAKDVELILYVHDGHRGVSEEDLALMRHYASVGVPMLIAYTKTDIMPAEQIPQDVKTLYEGGVECDVFPVSARKGRGIESGLATARMFNMVHPKRITTTGLTIFPDTPLQDMVLEGSFTEANEREKIEELRAFLSELDVDTFYDGIHYLNPLNFRLRVRDGEARKEVLREIDEILSTMCDEELELMVGRRHMHSL